MKRIVVSGAVLAVLAGGAGVSLADPGPNGKNNFGLCKAYFAGGENADKKRDKGPFPALEAEAGDQDGDDDVDSDDVALYCADIFPGGKTEEPGNGQGGSGNGADSKGRG